jgi:hypothetical protein
MTISKLPTSASLKEVMDKFEEISLQDIKSIDIKVLTSLPSTVVNNQIVIITNNPTELNSQVYFTNCGEAIPVGKLGVSYSITENEKVLNLNFGNTLAEIYLDKACRNTNGKLSRVECYLGKGGKWIKVSDTTEFIYLPSSSIDKYSIAISSNWAKSGGTLPSYSVTNYTTYIQYYTLAGGDIGKNSMYLKNPIDLTGVNYVKVKIATGYKNNNTSNNTNGASIGFTRKTSSFTVSDYVVKTSLTNSISGGNVEIKEVQLNVSNLIGEYYLTFYGEATGTSYRAHASMNLYEIELV